jgi:hypothetical protein
VEKSSSLPFLNIISRPPEQRRIVQETAETGVAFTAKKAADAVAARSDSRTAGMIMVHLQPRAFSSALFLKTYGANSVLLFQQEIVMTWSNIILPEVALMPAYLSLLGVLFAPREILSPAALFADRAHTVKMLLLGRTELIQRLNLFASSTSPGGGSLIPLLKHPLPMSRTVLQESGMMSAVFSGRRCFSAATGAFGSQGRAHGFSPILTFQPLPQHAGLDAPAELRVIGIERERQHVAHKPGSLRRRPSSSSCVQ